VKPREALAIDASVLRAGPDAFFWLFGPSTKGNERIGSIAVVTVSGPLEHHDDSWGESYEAIVKRLEAAKSGQDVVDAWEHKNRWASEAERAEKPALEPPSAVVMRLDSPGGVVSGCWEAVASIQKMFAGSDVKLIAYVDEMAASAAYALACACSEIVCPPSAILGSIGVISTMATMVRADEKDGYDFAILASGSRKADGHPHAPLTEAAIAAEQSRVDSLAATFFGIVAKSRGIPKARVESFQAGIFLGRQAVARGLADAVMPWADVILALGGEGSLDKKVPIASPDVAHSGAEEANMPLQLEALIKKTEAAMAAEKDPVKLTKLAANLEAYKKTKKHVEHVETEEDDDDDDEEDEKDKKEKDDEEDDDEEASTAAAPVKGKKEAKEKAEDGEDEEASALAMIRAATGGKVKSGALAALLAKAGAYDALADRVAKIEQKGIDDRKSSLISSALAGRKITPAEAKTLGAKKLDFVESFLEMRPKAIVRTIDEDEVVIPDGKPGAYLGKAVLAEIEKAVMTKSGSLAQQESLRKELMAAHLIAAQHAANGAAEGRF
jgi:ClpP class serine protease